MDIPNTGVYLITCTSNNYMYVGSATRSFTKRFREHISYLIKGVHHSNILQNCYNKYGLESLKFDILFRGEGREEILKQEQYWIDTLNPKCNICKYVASIRERPTSEETKQKIRKIHLGTKATDATKKRMSEAQKGRKHTPESKEKIRNGAIGIKKSESARNKMSLSKKKLALSGVRPPNYKIFSEIEQADIICDYMNGLSLHLLSQKYKVARPTLRSRLKEWGILLRNSGQIRYFGKEKPIKEKRQNIGARGVLVKDNNTGTVYGSVLDAAEKMGINYNTLKAKLRGQLKNNTTLSYVNT